MNGVGKTLPNNNKVILKDIYLSFFYGAKIGIIGLNGSGKSTLMKIIAGIETQYRGEVVWSPGYSVGYLEQEPQLDPSKTVVEVIREGVQETMDLLKEYEEVNMKFCEPMSDDEMAALIERQGELTEKIDHCNGWEVDSMLERAMDALNCPPPDASVSTLSGGERRRVALCRLLLRQPDVLLLDEPTNHLDTESIQWLEEHLKQYKGTVIAVTHDRYFLDNVAGWILELDRGEGIPWKGNYSSWLEQKSKRLQLEEKQESKRRKTLERELEWVRMAPKARQAKQKARLGAYEKLASADAKEKESNLEIYIPNGPHLGNKVIEFHDVSKAYGDKLLFEHLDFVLPPAGIVGVIGPNGAGKTTSFYMITGQIVPNAGRVFLDDEDITELPMYKRAQKGVGYLPQEASVFRKMSVEDNIMSVMEMSDMPKAERQERLEDLINEFNLSKVRKSLGIQLSGGERRRCEIARALAIDPKFILLDEPFAGVDPIAVEDIQFIIAKLKYKDIGVIITDHNVGETLAITDRAYLLYEGTILQQGTPESLAADEDVRTKYLGSGFVLKKSVSVERAKAEHAALEAARLAKAAASEVQG